MVGIKSEERASMRPLKTMKAAVRDVYGSADVVSIRDVPKPEIGDDEALVRVHAAGLDRGVWHLMTGTPYLLRIAGYGVRRPKNPVLGGDLSGIVEAIGKNVTRFKPGDPVYGVGDGSFAEYVRAKETQLAAKPANLTFEQAAAVPTSATTALQAIRDQGQVQSGQKVLVVGASGGVGTFAVQLAKAFGAEVTGVSSTSKLDLARSIGADHVIDYTRQDITDPEKGYDLIIDIGGNRPLSQVRRALINDGTLVITGGEGGKWIGDGVLRDFRALAISPFVHQRLRMFIAKQRFDDLLVLTELIEAGAVKPVIDQTYSLNDVPQAIRYLVDGHARGKLVIAI